VFDDNTRYPQTVSVDRFFFSQFQNQQNKNKLNSTQLTQPANMKFSINFNALAVVASLASSGSGKCKCAKDEMSVTVV
jgi:hypothetical protein